MKQLFVYIYTHDNFKIETLYNFNPFLKEPKLKNPTSVILETLSALTRKQSGYTFKNPEPWSVYKSVIFTKIISFIPLCISHFTARECTRTIAAIVGMLPWFEMYNPTQVKRIGASLPLLFDQLALNKSRASLDDLFETLCCAEKLINRGDNFNILPAYWEYLVDRMYQDFHLINPKKLALLISTIAKLKWKNELTNFTPLQLKALITHFLEVASRSDLYSLWSVLGAITLLGSHNMQTHIGHDIIVDLINRAHALLVKSPLEAVSSERLIMVLDSITQLVERGELESINLDWIDELFDRFIVRADGDCDSIGKGIAAMVKLYERGHMPFMQVASFEKLINQFCSQIQSAKPSAIADLLWAMATLAENKKLNIDPIQAQFLFDNLSLMRHMAHPDELRKASDAIIQLRVIAGPEFSAIKIVEPIHLTGLGEKLKALTGQEVFVIGSAAPNHDLPWNIHNSDVDLRMFGCDLQNLYESIIRWDCVHDVKFIEGAYPLIRFNFYANDATHLVELAIWQKIPEESFDSAILRNLDQGNRLNLESLYFQLTEKEHEIRGTNAQIISFVTRHISLTNLTYFQDDPRRILRLGRKINDYPHFEIDQNIYKIIADSNVQNCFYQYLKNDENIQLNEGRFSTALEGWLSRHSIPLVLQTMEQLGIFNAITQLQFTDIMSTLHTLVPYDQCCDDYTKRHAFQVFILSHICLQLSLTSVDMKNMAVKNWILYGVLTRCLRPEHRPLMDYIVDKVLLGAEVKEVVNADPCLFNIINTILSLKSVSAQNKLSIYGSFENVTLFANKASLTCEESKSTPQLHL